jgi:hypothetical protein
MYIYDCIRSSSNVYKVQKYDFRVIYIYIYIYIYIFNDELTFTANF